MSHHTECGIGESNPGRLVGSQESCHWTNPAACSGRRGSRTLKAHRSPGLEPGAVAGRLALPDRRAPAPGIEPASSRSTAGRSCQHELHRNCRVRQSGWPDSNRRSPAPKAGGFPGFPTSRRVAGHLPSYISHISHLISHNSHLLFYILHAITQIFHFTFYVS